MPLGPLLAVIRRDVIILNEKPMMMMRYESRQEIKPSIFGPGVSPAWADRQMAWTSMERTKKGRNESQYDYVGRYGIGRIGRWNRIELEKK